MLLLRYQRTDPAEIWQVYSRDVTQTRLRITL